MEIIDRKTLWSGEFIRTVLVTYRDRQGVERPWETVERVGTRGVVVIVPVTVSGELLLIRQYRPAIDSYVIELPAGLVGEGEDVLPAGRRELIEETGYAPGRIKRIHTAVMSTGINSDTWDILLASGCRRATDAELTRHGPDDNEDIEVIPVPWKSVHARLDGFARAGQVVDIRIYGFLEVAKKALTARGLPSGLISTRARKKP